MDMREWQEQQKKSTGHNNVPEKTGQPVKSHQQRSNSSQHGTQQRGGNAMGECFHNPYHFIPVPKIQGTRSGDYPKADFIKNTAKHLTHEKYLTDENHHSGRIVCRLDTVSPIFIGGRHPDRVERQALEIPHFELENGVPAIPATSIRGMITSLAEAASNSALRVLEGEQYSRRAAMNEALKAMGMLEKDPRDGKLKLRPLMMPAMKCDDMNGSNARLDKEYAALFTKPALRVYLKNYRQKPRTNPPEMEREPNTFLYTSNPDSCSATKQEIWFMQLGSPSMVGGTRPKIIAGSSSPHVKKILGKNGKPDSFQLMGDKPVRTLNTQDEIISNSKYNSLSPIEKKAFTPGIVRVLGLGPNDERSKHMPTGKTHEIFIPYDPMSPAGNLIDLGQALNEFHKLAKLQSNLETEPETPYTLKGSNCKVSGEFKLREGDLVFFSVDSSSKVTDIAISSIWRRRINGSCHEFFAGISKELLPMNKNRETISIVEQMFGFVSEQEKGSGDESLAFKSRVRFSNGIVCKKPKDGYYLEPKTLKILASPKPPSPSLYFKRHDGSFISKEGKDVLSKDRHDLPQGRKMYLHHKDTARNKPWETAPGLVNTNAEQKSKIAPMREGVSFYFHVDFNNLTDEELRLLCYSLAPTPTFMHKIGMAKPIGLGSVKITPEGLFLIDRKKRYTAEGYRSNNRYHKVWKGGSGEWPAEIYSAEFGSVGESCNSVNDIAEQYNPHPDIKKAIELLGEFPKHEVHYPRIIGGDNEDKLFQWFVANDKGIKEKNRNITGNNNRGKKTSLAPIDSSSTQLPTLESFSWEPIR